MFYGVLILIRGFYYPFQVLRGNLKYTVKARNQIRNLRHGITSTYKESGLFTNRGPNCLLLPTPLPYQLLFFHLLTSTSLYKRGPRRGLYTCPHWCLNTHSSTQTEVLSFYSLPSRTPLAASRGTPGIYHTFYISVNDKIGELTFTTIAGVCIN